MSCEIPRSLLIVSLVVLSSIVGQQTWAIGNLRSTASHSHQACGLGCEVPSASRTENRPKNDVESDMNKSTKTATLLADADKEQSCISENNDGPETAMMVLGEQIRPSDWG